MTEEDIQGVPKVLEHIDIIMNGLMYQKVIPQPNLQYYNIFEDFMGMEMFQLYFEKVRKDKLKFVQSQLIFCDMLMERSN